MVPATPSPVNQPARARIKPRMDEGELLRQVVEQRMAARLRLERQRESGIGINVDALDRIHLDGDGEAHQLSRRLSVASSAAASDCAPGDLARMMYSSSEAMAAVRLPSFAW